MGIALVTATTPSTGEPSRSTVRSRLSMNQRRPTGKGMVEIRPRRPIAGVGLGSTWQEPRYHDQPAVVRATVEGFMPVLLLGVIL